MGSTRRSNIKFTRNFSWRAARNRRALSDALRLSPGTVIDQPSDFVAVGMLAGNLPGGFRADAARAALATMTRGHDALSKRSVRAVHQTTALSEAMSPVLFRRERNRAAQGIWPSSLAARSRLQHHIGSLVARSGANVLIDVIINAGLQEFYRDRSLDQLRLLMNVAPATGNAVASAALAQIMAIAREEQVPVSESYVLSIASLVEWNLAPFRPADTRPGQEPSEPRPHAPAGIVATTADITIKTIVRDPGVSLASRIVHARRFAEIWEQHGDFDRVREIYGCIGDVDGCERASENRARQLLDRDELHRYVTTLIRFGDSGSPFTAKDLVEGALVAAVTDGRPAMIEQVRNFAEPDFFTVLCENLRAHGYGSTASAVELALGPDTRTGEPDQETLAEVILLSSRSISTHPPATARSWDLASRTPPQHGNAPARIAERISRALELQRVSGDDFGI